MHPDVIAKYIRLLRCPIEAVSRRQKGTAAHLWLERQKRDVYVELSKRENYRCRSAYKLLEINERYKLLDKGMIVVDVGACPGSWSQVAIKAVIPGGTVIAIDKQPIHPIEGVIMLPGSDFRLPETQEKLRATLGDRKCNAVISDMAPNASGVRQLDHDKIIELCYAVVTFAVQVSAVGGSVLVKLWEGKERKRLEETIRRFYTFVAVVRPDACRSDSTECYLLGREFKGLKT